MRHRQSICSIFVVLSFVFVLGACSGDGAPAAPVIQENWEFVKLLRAGAQWEQIVDVVTVRSCESVESKEAHCSAGTQSDLTFGIEIGLQAGVPGLQGMVSSEVLSGLGVGRESGESLVLEPAPEGHIIEYRVLKKFEVKSGEVLARNDSGEERKTTYTFHANCSLTIESTRSFTCPGVSNATADASTRTIETSQPPTVTPRPPTITPKPPTVTPKPPTVTPRPPTPPPTPVPTPVPTVIASSTKSTYPQIFGHLLFCEASDFEQETKRCLVSHDVFTGIIEIVYVSWEPSQKYVGAAFKRKWYLDDDSPFLITENFNEYAYLEIATRASLKPGTYFVELYVGDEMVQKGGFVIR